MKDTSIKKVDEYIALQPTEVREKLEKLRQAIKKAAPKAEEVVSYMMPAYKFYGVLVYFGAYKSHIGFYPTAGALVPFKKSYLFTKAQKARYDFLLTNHCHLG